MRRTLAPIALAACLVAGCMMGPDYKRPEVDVPQGWLPPRPAAPIASQPVPASVAAIEAKTGPSARLAQADASLVVPPVPTGGIELLDTAWWGSFDDPKFDELVRIAVEENKDLKIAAFRIQQYDAFLQVSQSKALPQIGYTGDRLRNTLSENRQVKLSPGTEPVDNDYALSVEANWELDLWGKVRRANEAAYAKLVASEEDRRALVQSIVAQLATGYVQLLALDRELELLRASIASQRETVRLSEAKFRDGASSESPVLRALADLQQMQAEVPVKESAIAALENALQALLGRNPGPIERGKPIAELRIPKVPAGLPASLLEQRPDVRKTEEQLIAANAGIGVAKALYLPTISLTASSGFASNDLTTLTNLTSNFGKFGVELLGPIFTFGRLEGQVREAEALQLQAQTAYLRSVQTALHEVEDALTGHGKTRERVTLNALQVDVLREQKELARKRFEGGGSGYLEVLDAERQLNVGLLLQNQTRRDEFTTLIAVYKALGGGWALPDVKMSRPPASEGEQ